MIALTAAPKKKWRKFPEGVAQHLPKSAQNTQQLTPSCIVRVDPQPKFCSRLGLMMPHTAERFEEVYYSYN